MILEQSSISVRITPRLEAEDLILSDIKYIYVLMESPQAARKLWSIRAPLNYVSRYLE